MHFSLTMPEALALISVFAPLAGSIAAVLYKHLLERLPSNQRAVVAGVAGLVGQVVGDLSTPAGEAQAVALAQAVLKSPLVPGRLDKKLDPQVLASILQATFGEQVGAHGGGGGSGLNDGEGADAAGVIHGPLGFLPPSQRGLSTDDGQARTVESGD